MLKKTRDKIEAFKSLPSKVLLKNIHVVDNAEKLNGKKSIVIQNGKIVDILDEAPATFDGEIREDNNSI